MWAGVERKTIGVETIIISPFFNYSLHTFFIFNYDHKRLKLHNGAFFEQDFLDAADKNKFVCSKLHEIKQYLLIFLLILMLGMYHIICHMYIYKNISATINQGRKLFKGGKY